MNELQLQNLTATLKIILKVKTKARKGLERHVDGFDNTSKASLPVGKFLKNPALMCDQREQQQVTAANYHGCFKNKKNILVNHWKDRLQSFTMWP